jgi:hypothetical protein
MADRILFIGFGTPVRGREERAVEVFDECVGLYGRMQQEGRIDGFDVVILEASGGLGGWFTLRGTDAQLDAVQHDREFRRMIVDAEMVADDLQMCRGATGSAIAEEMEIYREAVARVPQFG